LFDWDLLGNVLVKPFAHHVGSDLGGRGNKNMVFFAVGRGVNYRRRADSCVVTVPDVVPSQRLQNGFHL
jgi:hypothetical protein